LEQFADLPVLLFAAQWHKPANGGEQAKVRVTAVDKRTGKLVYDNEHPPTSQFHTLRIDPHAGLIALVRQDLMIQLRLDAGSQTAKAEPAAPAPTVRRDVIVR
jgi:hypothetical protein